MRIVVDGEAAAVVVVRCSIQKSLRRNITCRLQTFTLLLSTFHLITLGCLHDLHDSSFFIGESSQGYDGMMILDPHAQTN